MKAEEYQQQQREEGAREWARLEAIVGAGKHPTKEELALAVFHYGVTPFSPAASYVGQVLAGLIKRPRGNPGHRARSIAAHPTAVRWLYFFHLEELQVLKKADPKAYGKHHKGKRPHEVALQRTATHFDAGREVVRKVVRSTKWPAKWWVPPK